MKRIAFILTALLVCACAKEDTASIKGTASGVKDGKQLYLQELGENNKMTPLDTAVVTSESFQFEKPISNGNGLNILTMEDSNSRLILVQEAAPLNITVYKDSLGVSRVQGGKENELFNDYVRDNQAKNQKKASLQRAMAQAQRETDGVAVNEYAAQIKEIDEQYITNKKAIIRDHPDAMVSVLALSDLINAKVLKIEETENLYASLDEDLQKSTIGSTIATYIAQLKSQRIAEGLASIGNQAPEFSAPTPDGKELALSQTLGKYTIIDFWASWCRPCRMENPNVVRVYNKYHDKGLNIISVSLDKSGAEARWKQAIKKDQMDWYHVSNLKFWQDPIAKQYGVRSIPATFLLDENGVIIAKNLRGQALEDKIAELLGDS